MQLSCVAGNAKVHQITIGRARIANGGEYFGRFSIHHYFYGRIDSGQGANRERRARFNGGPGRPKTRTTSDKISPGLAGLEDVTRLKSSHARRRVHQQRPQFLVWTLELAAPRAMPSRRRELAVEPDLLALRYCG